MPPLNDYDRLYPPVPPPHVDENSAATIACPDCGFDHCHQRGDSTAYCPRCCAVFGHLSGFARLINGLL